MIEKVQKFESFIKSLSQKSVSSNEELLILQSEVSSFKNNKDVSFVQSYNADRRLEALPVTIQSTRIKEFLGEVILAEFLHNQINKSDPNSLIHKVLCILVEINIELVTKLNQELPL
jgi:hypothetical protein